MQVAHTLSDRNVPYQSKVHPTFPTKFPEIDPNGISAHTPGAKEGEHTGGSVDYYKVLITNPTTATEQYTAECNDIIEALGMSYAEGNVFKAIWRSCAAKNLGKTKKGLTTGVYDAEKVVFFGQRLLAQAGIEAYRANKIKEKLSSQQIKS